MGDYESTLGANYVSKAKRLDNNHQKSSKKLVV